MRVGGVKSGTEQENPGTSNAGGTAATTETNLRLKRVKSGTEQENPGTSNAGGTAATEEVPSGRPKCPHFRC